MKRVFCYVALLLPLLLLCGCPHNCGRMSLLRINDSIESNYYIPQYWNYFNVYWANSKQSHNPDCVDLVYRPYWGFSLMQMESANIMSEAEELERFLDLAASHGDTLPYCEIKRFVKFGDYSSVFAYDFNQSACAHEIDSINVFSLDDWDDEHPAGSSLNDIIRFDAYTPKDYIRSGFSDTVPKLKHIKKLLSETVKEDFDLVTYINADDKQFAGHLRFFFVSKPTLSLDCQRLYIVMTLDDGHPMGYKTEYKLSFSE